MPLTAVSDQAICLTVDGRLIPYKMKDEFSAALSCGGVLIQPSDPEWIHLKRQTG
jgi:hypothetical protein